MKVIAHLDVTDPTTAMDMVTFEISPSPESFEDWLSDLAVASSLTRINFLHIYTISHRRIFLNLDHVVGFEVVE